jgi:hypothetical protein
MSKSQYTRDIIYAIFGLVGVVIFVALIMGVMYISTAFNSANFDTQIITPTAGIECVVVASSAEIAVDCWKAL